VRIENGSGGGKSVAGQVFYTTKIGKIWEERAIKIPFKTEILKGIFVIISFNKIILH
jgi:hypothetical protein